MKKRLIMIALAMAVAVAALPAAAQLGSLATVKGRVTGLQNEPLTGASGFLVQITNTDNGRKFSAGPNGQGEFQMAGVPLGVYSIVLLKDGKVVWSLDKKQLEPDNNGMVDLPIDLAKIAAAEQASGGKPNAEQQKKIEEIKKKNAEIEAYNTKVRAVKPLLEQADAAEKSGNMQQATTLLAQASQTAPDFDIVWFKLGDAYLKNKQPQQAVEPLQKAVSMKPDNTAYHILLGEALLKSGNSAGSVKEFTAATQAQNDPNLYLAYFNLGAALTQEAAKAPDAAARTKLTDDATAAFDKATSLKPDFADAYYQKGVNLLGKATYTKEGKIEPVPGTAEALNKYLELQPNGPHAEEAKQLLASLGEAVQTTYKKGKK